jgi:hypothetical protein
VTDLLRRGALWLEQMRNTHCTTTVIYRRGESEQEVPATFGRTDYEIAAPGAITVGSHSWDFLIGADEFDDGFKPEPGDVIEANGSVYEVSRMGEAIQGWRWSDQFQTTFRIHTKLIGSVDT